jgi:DNA polymerase V
MIRYALIDCNNFYVSCERLFNPRLRRRPVVVLSNNDGCIIARSNEAKAMGISMGEPYFKQKEFLRRRGVRVFSSNYALYGDLSHRVMSVLQQMEPEVEIYSIDEAFVRLPPQHEQRAEEQGRALKERVERCVGIPVSVGLARTKTLAKLAARAAKKNGACNGVFALDADNAKRLLAATPVHDVWGVGCRLTKKLNRLGIYTALELADSDGRRIRRHCGLPLLRTVMELRGKPCIELEKCPPARKSVVSSRSFSRPLTSLQDLREAVSSYISIGARKLRDQGLAAANLHVFLSTSRYRTDIPRFSGSRMAVLDEPTACTATLIRAGMRELERLYKKNLPYNKAGIMLTGLSDAAVRQRNLFQASTEEKSRPLMEALDRVNDRWGRDVLRYASSGLQREWRMKQAKKSPAYTTCWDELPTARDPVSFSQQIQTSPY